VGVDVDPRLTITGTVRVIKVEDRRNLIAGDRLMLRPGMELSKENMLHLVTQYQDLPLGIECLPPLEIYVNTPLEVAGSSGSPVRRIEAVTDGGRRVPNRRHRTNQPRIPHHPLV